MPNQSRVTMCPISLCSEYSITARTVRPTSTVFISKYEDKMPENSHPEICNKSGTTKSKEEY